MNHLNSAREHITSAFQATGENQMRSLRCAQVHAQIAQAESLQRIAECLETLVEAQTPDAADPAYFDATPDPLADLAPDWSQAPEWAQWYAVDEDGRRDWYECIPLRRNGFWMQAEGTECEYAGGADGGLPAYVDWRTLKWQRPQAQGATGLPDWLPEWRGG